MRRKIKFGLPMKNNKSVRTLDDMRENFDLQKAIIYFYDGRLREWLLDRFYCDKVKVLDDINHSDEHLADKLCFILGIHDETSLTSQKPNSMMHIAQKRNKLREYISDDFILDSVECVAFNDDELQSIIKKGYKTIYLIGNYFNICIANKNIHYIGIGQTKPSIRTDASNIKEIHQAGIQFQNVNLPDYLCINMKQFNIDKVYLIRAICFEAAQGCKRELSSWNENHISWCHSLNYNTQDHIKDIVFKKLLKKYIFEEVAFVDIYTEGLNYKNRSYRGGIAFTKDSFCYDGTSGSFIIPYEDIKSMNTGSGRDYYNYRYEYLSLNLLGRQEPLQLRFKEATYVNVAMISTAIKKIQSVDFKLFDIEYEVSKIIKKIFSLVGNKKWVIYNTNDNSIRNIPTNEEKNKILDIIGFGEVDEKDILYASVNDDFSCGFIFTSEIFYIHAIDPRYGWKYGPTNMVIDYTEIDYAEYESNKYFKISGRFNKNEGGNWITLCNRGAFSELVMVIKILNLLAIYLQYKEREKLYCP